MSWPRTELPAPGRFSLARVVAARLGHARRRAQACTQNCNQGRDCTCCPVVIDRLREDYDTEDQQPLTGREALRFWLVTGAPAFCGVIGFALLIWLTKP